MHVRVVPAKRRVIVAVVRSIRGRVQDRRRQVLRLRRGRGSVVIRSARRGFYDFTVAVPADGRTTHGAAGESVAVR